MQAPPRFDVRIHPIVYAQREIRRDYRLARTNEIHERLGIRTSRLLFLVHDCLEPLIFWNSRAMLIRRVSLYVLI